MSLYIHHPGGRIGIQRHGMLGGVQPEGIAREFEIVEEKAIRIKDWGQTTTYPQASKKTATKPFLTV